MSSAETKKKWDSLLGKSSGASKSGGSSSLGKSKADEDREKWSNILGSGTQGKSVGNPANKYGDASAYDYLESDEAKQFHQWYSGQVNAGNAYNASKQIQGAVGGIYNRGAGNTIKSSGITGSAQVANQQAKLAINQIEDSKSLYSEEGYNAWKDLAGTAYANTDEHIQKWLRARAGDASALTEQQAIIDELMKSGENDNWWNKLWGTHSYSNQDAIDEAKAELETLKNHLRLHGMESIRDRKPKTSMIDYDQDTYQSDLMTILYKAQGLDIPSENYLEAAKRVRGFVGSTAVEQEAFADPSGQWMDKYRGLYDQRMNTLDKYIDKYSGTAGTEYDLSAEDYVSYQRAYDDYQRREAEKEQRQADWDAGRAAVHEELAGQPDYAQSSQYVKGGDYITLDESHHVANIDYGSMLNDLVQSSASPQAFEEMIQQLEGIPGGYGAAAIAWSGPVRYMTDEDRQDFFTVYNTQGWRAAEAFLRDELSGGLYRQYNEEVLQQREENVRKSAWNAAWYSAGSIAENIMASLASTSVGVSKALGMEVSADDPRFLWGQMAGVTRSTTGQMIADATQGVEILGHNIGKIAYDGLMSAMDSAANTALFGHGATGMMSAGAFGSSYQENLASMGDTGDAFMDAAVDGVIEAATEYFSVEALLDDTVTSAWKSLAKQALTEPSEEVFGELLRMGYDMAKYGENSQINQQIAELRVKGYTEVEAEEAVAAEFMSGLTETIMTAAVSGVAGGAPGAVRNATANRQTGKALQQNAGDSGYRSLMDLADTVELSKGGRKIYEQLKAEMDAQNQAQESAAVRRNAEIADEMDSESAQDELAGEKNRQAQQEAAQRKDAEIAKDLDNTIAQDELLEEKNRQAQEEADQRKDAEIAEDLGNATARTELVEEKKNAARRKNTSAQIGRLYREVMQKLDAKAQEVLREYMSFDVAKELKREGVNRGDVKALAGSILRVQDGSFTQEDMQAISESAEARTVLSMWTAVTDAATAAKGKVEKLAGLVQKKEETPPAAEEQTEVETEPTETGAEPTEVEDEFDAVAADVGARDESTLVSEGDTSTLDGAEIEILGVEAADGAAPKIKVRTADGAEKSVAADSIAYGAKDAAVYKLAAYSAEYGRNGDLMYNGYRPGQDVDEYARAFHKAAQYGSDGRNLEVLKASGAVDALTGGQARTAYEIGRAMRASRSQAQQAELAAKGADVETGKLDVSGINMAQLNTQQRASVDVMGKLAQTLGINVRFVESVANEEGRYTTENGSYDARSRTLTLDVHAGSNYASDTHYAVMHTAGHELTHYIRQFADSGLWDGYQEFVMGHLDGKMDLGAEIQRRMDNAQLTREAAIEEIVADASGEALRGLTEDQIQEMAQEKPKLAQKIARFMKKWIGDLKRQIEIAFKGTEAKTEVARQMRDALDEMAEMWNGILVQASKRANAGEGQIGQVLDEVKFSKRDGVEFAEDKYFSRLIDQIESAKQGSYIRVGAVLEGSVLNDVGLPAANLYFDVSKVNKALAEHGDHLTKDLLKQIPEILRNPVVVAEANVKNTVNVFGDIWVDKSPVMVGIVVAQDVSGRNVINKIRTMHARRDFMTRITDESILYLDANKKRTRNWFQTRGNVVPLGGTKFGFICSIAQTDDSVKFSKRDDSDEAKSIKQQIAAHADELNDMPVVAKKRVHLPKNGGIATLRSWAIDTLASSGYKVDRQGFGVIEFSPSRIKNSLNYLESEGELAAIVAVPNVLKRGIEVGGHTNHKGRDYRTITFAAPVEINGVRGNMAITVIQTNANHYKTHRILMPDGSSFVYNNKEATVGTRVYSGENDAAPTITQVASNPIITQPDDSVKYQQRDPDQVSDRELLATALQSVTQNADEWDNLQRYQKKIAALNEKQRMLEQTNARIAELTGQDAVANRDELIRLKNNAGTLARSIDRADGELLKYEAMRPIQKLAERQREAYREKLNAQMEARKARLKLDTQDRIREVREREAEKRRRLREQGDERLRKAVVHTREVGARRVERMKESEMKAKYKGRIQKDVSTMRTWLTKPDNKGHVPQFLRAPLADFLESLDFTSARALKGGDATQADRKLLDKMDAMRRALARTRSQQSDIEGGEAAFRGYLDLPEGFAERFDEAVASIRRTLELGGGDTPINRMTGAQLKDLSDMVRTINSAVRKMNSFLADNRYRQVSEAARNTMDALDRLGEKTGRSAALEKVSGFLDWTNATPYYAFKRFGEGGKAVFEGLMNGWDRLAFNSKELIDYANEAYTTEQVRAWSREVQDIELNGRRVQMTTAQIMSLYCLNKRQQARGHLLGGGIRIADIQTKGKVIRQADNHILGAGDIRRITGLLTAEQRAVADKLQAFMNTRCTEWGNEVSMKRFGYEAFGDEANYFPIETDSNNLKGVDEKTEEISMFRLLNLSATKSTVQNANNALVVRDIFDVFSSHSADMAKYNALALPILDALKWYNYVDKTNYDDGSLDTRSIQKSLEKAYGTDAQRYIKSFLRDLNGVREGGRNDGPINRMLSNYKVAAVAANLRVGLLQITSMPRAAYAIDPKYLAIGMARNVAFKNSKPAAENVGISLWKSLGFYDTNISRNVREMVKHDQNLGDRIKEKSMILAEKGDAWTMGVLYGAVQAEMADKHPGVSVGSEAYKHMVNERMREIVYQTQVVDSTMTRSDIMRDTKAKSSLATAFMSEPTLTMNMLADSIYEQRMKARETGRRMIAPSKKMVRAFAVNAVVLTFSAVLESAFTAWRDDDEYETFEEKFEAAAVGEYDDDMSGWQRVTEFLSSSLGGNLNLANNIPLVKDVLEAFQGRSTERMDSAWAYTLRQGVREVYKYLTGQSNNPPYNGIYKTLNGLSQMSGFAVGGMVREGISFYNNCVAAPMGWRKIQTYKDSASDAAGAILRAYAAGEEDMVARYIKLAAMYGLEEDELQSAMTRVAKKAHTTGKVDDEILLTFLVSYADKGADDVYWLMKEWDYTGEDEFSKYSDLSAALAGADGKAAQMAYRELVEHGTKEETVIGQISKLYNSGEATNILSLQLRSGQLYNSTLKLKADGEAHKNDFDDFISAIVNGSGIAGEIEKLMDKGYTIKQCMSAINGAFGKSNDRYRVLETYNSREAAILLDRILDAYEALGLDRQEEIAWINENWTM